MAIARLSVKTGSVGKGAQHAAYIAREDKYAYRLDRGERLEAKDYGNMPTWAKDNPQQFWLAADVYERKNGTAYREMEIVLPRELDISQREVLVREWVTQEIGDKHAYQWAIHTPTAADGGAQPHVHLMFSERQCDSIERDPQHYFRRYNSKEPERGGARKGYGEHAGQTLTLDQRRHELMQLRGRWEVRCNTHLERARVDSRIDMRSYAAQGSEVIAEKKHLPGEWRDSEVRAKVLDFRAAKAEQDKVRLELDNFIKLEQVQKKQLACLHEYRQKIAQLSRREVERRANDPAGDMQRRVDAAVMKDPRTQASNAKIAAQEKILQQSNHAFSAVKTQREHVTSDLHQWEQDHRFRRWLHDNGVKSDTQYTVLQSRYAQTEALYHSASAATVQAKKNVCSAEEMAKKQENSIRQEYIDRWERSPDASAYRQAIQERAGQYKQKDKLEHQRRELEYQRLIAEKQRKSNEPEKERQLTRTYITRR